MMKRHLVLVVWACCLLVVAGCNKHPQPPQEPSDSDGIPTAHEILVVDVKEEITPLPDAAKPAAPKAPAKSEAKPAPVAPKAAAVSATPTAPAAPVAPARKPAARNVATARPKKVNPLKAAFDKKDVLAVAEDTPKGPAPKAKTFKPKAKPKDKSPADDAAAKKTDEPKGDPEVLAVQETLTAFAKAVESADKKTFLATVYYTKAEEPAIKVIWNLISESNGFEKDMKKAYGQKGVEAIKKNQQMRIGASVPSPEDIAKNMKVKVTGNKAKATITGQRQPMSLVKQDGQWKAQLLPPGQMQGPGGQMAMAMMKTMTQGIKTTRKKVGKPGYTPEKIMKELSKATMPGGEMPPDAAKALKARRKR